MEELRINQPKDTIMSQIRAKVTKEKTHIYTNLFIYRNKEKLSFNEELTQSSPNSAFSVESI